MQCRGLRYDIGVGQHAAAAAVAAAAAAAAAAASSSLWNLMHLSRELLTTEDLNIGLLFAS